MVAEHEVDAEGGAGDDARLGDVDHTLNPGAHLRPSTFQLDFSRLCH